MSPPIHSTRPPRPAFTLVEMVIVIGIIILLAGLTLSVSVAVVRGSEVRETESTIRLLETALLEWEAQADRQVTYGINNLPYPGAAYEIAQPAANLPLQHFNATAHLVSIVAGSTAIKDILARIDPEYMVSWPSFTDGNGNAVPESRMFLDAWGNKILAVFPGRDWAQSDLGQADADGTITTPLEVPCGAAVNRRICFISAGPDGQFGDVSQSPASPAFQSAGDNVTSYTPIIPDPP